MKQDEYFSIWRVTEKPSSLAFGPGARHAHPHVIQSRSAAIWRRAFRHSGADSHGLEVLNLTAAHTPRSDHQRSLLNTITSTRLRIEADKHTTVLKKPISAQFCLAYFAFYTLLSLAEVTIPFEFETYQKRISGSRIQKKVNDNRTSTPSRCQQVVAHKRPAMCCRRCLP